MKNMKLLYCLLFVALSLPLLGSDCCKPCEFSCDSFWGIKAEAKVAYYAPSSKKVRRIYGEGWADYQLEFSKIWSGIGGVASGSEYCQWNQLEWSVWTGISGFSRKGESIGFHDDTKLQLIPINFGLKVFYPIFFHTKIYIGGAACYSLLQIHDDSESVHKHVRKEGWGGLFQSGITYDFCDWGYVSAFFDYYFQRFNFHDNQYSSHSGSSDDYENRYIQRSDLNMNGYKVGIGLGVSF